MVILLKIGIKFCGGCNSKFNRRQVLDEIKEKYNEHEYEYVKDDQSYDYVIAIQGCQVNCANLDNFYSKFGIINFNSEDICLLDNYL